MRVLLAVCATALYAIEITITDVRLSKFDPLRLAFTFNLMLAAISIIGVGLTWGRTSEGLPLDMRAYWFAGLVAVFSFFADVVHFYAFHRGAGAVLVSTCYLAIPIIASVIKAEAPSYRLVVAWLLTGAALLLVATDGRRATGLIPAPHHAPGTQTASTDTKGLP